MVWGETDSARVFQPQVRGRPDGPRRYAVLLDAAYSALKSRSRRNIVIGAMTHNLGDVRNRGYVKWLRLPNGKPPRMDLWGHNSFSDVFPDLKNGPRNPGRYDFSATDTLARAVARVYRAWNRRVPRIWMSETTISSDRANRAFAFHVSRERQADWLAFSYRIAELNPRIFAAVGWFGLMDEPRTVRRGLTTGLMTYEGERKPAFFAYQRAN
jgi:hypothetical protein